MRVARGNGLAKIVAEEARRRRRLRARPRPHRAREAAPVAVCRLRPAASGSCPAFLVVAAVFCGLRPRAPPGYDREYEQEPPTDTEPALVPTLLRQGGEAGSFEFTATLFDLIRRGVYASTPVTTERSTWAGLRKESVADLELSAGKRDEQLTPWENAVAARRRRRRRGRRRSACRASASGSRTTATSMSKRFTAFKANVSDRGRATGSGSSRSAPCRSSLALLVFAGIGALLVLRRRSTAGARSTRAGATSCCSGSASPRCMNAAIVLGALDAAQALAAPLRARRDRGRALGGVPPLPDRLPAPAGGAAGDAGALGAVPRLRDRVRDRRPRAPGGAHGDARGARAGVLDLLDLDRAATSARARPRSRSAISPPASARRSRRRPPARAEAAAASPAVAAAAEAAEAAAPGSSRPFWTV